MPALPRILFGIVCVLLLSAAPVLSAAADEQTASKPAANSKTAKPEFNSEQIIFFNTKVRPLLKARCFKCHGGTVKEPKGNLRLDSRAAILKGGDSGPAATPGKPGMSLLIEAVNYNSFEMPPRSKLPAGEIAILTKWVKQGLPYSQGTSKPRPDKPSAFPLKQRKNSHWAWQPLRKPALPAVQDDDWPATPIDRFILAKLEAKGLQPAPQADRRTLIRRAYFDLIGLPPSPDEVAEFVHDPASTRKAFAKVVDRLLKSPHFGERWARHWLDLVRYADTLGHEFDYPLRHAHRYRDYVIRAFNADVPYDQFVKEHIAGDLLQNPRRHPQLGFNESVIGTGFWFLGEDKHAPVDVKGEEAGRIDNQIDVFSKTFLGLTVACARCHDHKFDAITTKDYYALHGFLQSSRRQTALLDPGGTIRQKTATLQKLHRQINKQLRRLPHASDGIERSITNYLLAARDVLTSGDGGERVTVNAAANQHNVKPDRLKKLLSVLQSKESANPAHPLWVWKQLSRKRGEDFAKHRAALHKSLRQSAAAHRSAVKKTQRFADFNGRDFGKWFVTGFAFGSAPTKPGECDVTGDGHGRRFLQPGVVHSGRYGKQLAGVLRSPTFTLGHDTILYRVKGRNARIRLIIDGYRMDEFNGLLFRGCLMKVDTKGKWTWMRQGGDIHRYKGHRAHIEIIDDGNGWIAVDEVRFADRGDPVPPNPPTDLAKQLLRDETITNPQTLAAKYGELMADSLSSIRPGDAESGSAFAGQRFAQRETVLNAGLQSGLLTLRAAQAAADNQPSLAQLAERMRRIDQSLPPPMRVIAMTDGSPEDEHVFIRGSHKNLGPVVPRRMLTAISGDNQPRIEHGSGRLKLAERLLDESNPFPARVMVNRLWHHLTGRGIVASVDNFGELGRRPTHPELLDWLAATFRQDGWSVKRMIRRIMLSGTYMMASTPNPAAEKSDPQNLLLHRMRIRRLEGEAIRDSLLTVSGRLDRTMFGPPVPIHLTPFMQGRGRPRKSGPLDGNGRRSIYIIVRRNFLSPMLLAFDTPIPFTTIGRRNVSNVPAQALILMNDPFVVQQARLWTKRVLKDRDASPEDRIRRMYRTAFSREPTTGEIANATTFLREQAGVLGLKENAWKIDHRVWSDFAHVLFNAKEFIYLR